jgi:hypothetical protein
MFILELAELRRVEWKDEWKANFVRDIHNRYILDKEISEAQAAKIHEIYLSYYKADVPRNQSTNVIAGYSIKVDGKVVKL